LENTQKSDVKPRVGFVPFSYPDYPRELVIEFAKKSEETLRDIGLDVIATDPIITWNDVESALKLLRSEDLDSIIAAIISWVEAPNVIAVLKEFLNKPIVLWSHTMFMKNNELLTLGPLPGAGVIKESLEEMGIKFRFIWGMPDEKGIKDKLKLFVRVSHALHRLNKSKIGLLGYASMGMYTGTFDHVLVRQKIGPEIEHLDQYMIIKEVENISDEEAKKLIEKVRSKWDISKEVTEKDLLLAMKMYLALKNLAKKFGWNALTVKCQYELSRYYGFAPCVPLSMLADEITCSCEGDVPLIITQLIMHYLTGLTVTYGDVHLISNDHILLGACGFAPFKLSMDKPKISKHTALYLGLLNCTAYKKGRVTLARLSSFKKDSYSGFKMHIAVGEADIPEPFHEVGCPPYPSMKVKLDGSTDHFGQNLMSQHYAIVYQDIKNELLELCDFLGIKPIVS